jgi:hypothetical protein
MPTITSHVPAPPRAPTRAASRCETCSHRHPGPPHAQHRETPPLEGPAGCRDCRRCALLLRGPVVPAGLRAGHMLLLACVQDLCWEESGDPAGHVGLVDLARRFAAHAWPPVLPVPPRHATWADPAWLVEDCQAWGLVEVHHGLPAGRPGPTRLVAVSLSPAGRRVLDTLTWRPRTEPGR